jgi:hypothetical protein
MPGMVGHHNELWWFGMYEDDGVYVFLGTNK